MFHLSLPSPEECLLELGLEREQKNFQCCSRNLDDLLDALPCIGENIFSSKNPENLITVFEILFDDSGTKPKFGKLNKIER